MKNGIRSITRDLSLRMFGSETPIGIEKILLCLMTRPPNRTSVFTPQREREIYLRTGMRDSDIYETLGDAVYDIMFLTYTWKNNIHLDMSLLCRSKSNITMSRLCERSSLFPYVRMTQKVRTCKSTADVFEATVGMIFDHLVSNNYPDITGSLFLWMNKVFKINKIFHDLVYNRLTPSGVVIRASPQIDLLYYYRLSIQKLLCVYYLFLVHRHQPRASTIIHNLYVPHRDNIDGRIRETIDFVIGSDDPLLYIAQLQSDSKVLFS